MTAAMELPFDAGCDSTTPRAPAFRAAYGSFAARVTVVTVGGPDGAHGATVNAVTSVTVDPPRAMVCPAKDSRTWRAVGPSGRFSVDILPARQQPVAGPFASHGSDPMTRVRWRAGADGSPVPDDVVGVLEGDLCAALKLSTRIELIGAVKRAEHGPKRSPLVLVRSTLHTGLMSGEPR